MKKNEIKIILAIISVLLSGAAGLIYEVTWHKYLCNLLGSQAKASAIILSVFLGGLSLGYLLFGKLSKNKNQKLLLNYAAWIEIGISVWAIFFPIIYIILWDKTRILPSTGLLAFILEIIVTCLLILTPTTLMGSTLPLLTKGLVNNTNRTKSIHALIYSFNTFGAFFGTLIAGFYILPEYGLSTTVQASSILNLIAGLILFVCSKLTNDENLVEENKETVEQHIKFDTACLIVFALGFCSISLQTCLIRLFSLSVGSSEYSFTIVVSMFVLMLAIGAMSVRNIEVQKNTVRNNLLICLLGLIIIYVTAEKWPYYCLVIRSLLKTLEPNFYFYHLLLLILLSSICITAIAFMGRTLPLIFSSVVGRYDDSGDTVGKLYSLNTLGCILGAIFGGYLLLFYVDLYFVLKICILLTTLCIPINKKYYLINLTVISLLLYNLPAWNHDKLSSGVFRHTKIDQNTFAGANNYYQNTNNKYTTKFAKDDPNSTIRIIEKKAYPGEETLNHGAQFVRALYVNGKSDGQTSYGDMDTMKLVAHIPALLSTEALSEVAVVGLGLGVSAGTLTLYPEVKKIDVIEISHSLIKASKLFDFANNSLSTNPKTNYLAGDAYRVLGGQENKYSLIISEPSNPWVTGVERLYTSEYFEIIKNKLTKNGIYAQWFHLYSISEKTLGVVLSTFGNSFKNTRFFIVDSDIILLGSEQDFGKDNIHALLKKYQQNEIIKKDLSLININNIESILSLEAWLPIQLYSDEQKHTLEFPILAYAAGKDFFMNYSVEYDELLRKPNYAPWVRRKSANTLYTHYLAETEDKITSLSNFANSACKDMNISDLPKDINALSPVCKDASVALGLIGKISHNNIFNDSEAELIKQLLISDESQQNEDFWASVGQRSSIQDLRKLIALYHEFDSAFTPLSPKKIILATESCFSIKSDETDSCKAELTYALANTGWGTFSKNIYNKLPEELKNRHLTLPELIDSSLESEFRIK